MFVMGGKMTGIAVPGWPNYPVSTKSWVILIMWYLLARREMWYRDDDHVR